MADHGDPILINLMGLLYTPACYRLARACGRGHHREDYAKPSRSARRENRLDHLPETLRMPYRR